MATNKDVRHKWIGSIHIINRAHLINDHVHSSDKQGEPYELGRADRHRYHWLFCYNKRWAHVEVGACPDLCKGTAMCFASCFDCKECVIVGTLDKRGKRDPIMLSAYGETYNASAVAAEGYL